MDAGNIILKEGDKIKVDSIKGNYKERAKEPAQHIFERIEDEKIENAINNLKKNRHET